MTKTAATKFQVRWRKSDEPDTLWSSPVDVGKDGNVKVPGLERVTDYVFQARAGSDCGAWSDWIVQTFNMPDATLPSAVTSLTAQSVADGVHLAWASVIADGGTIFSIERSSSATSGFTERAQTRATAYTDPETSGTIYYYRVRALNFRGGTGPYSNVVSSQGVAVDQLGDDVQAAQTAADNAQHAADAANTQLAAIASDSILSPAEKPAVIRDYDVITTEQAGIDGQATAYSITTEKTAYDNAISALTAYLATLTSDTAWNDKSGNTTIVAATFKGNFAAVYTTRQALLDAIYAAAKKGIDTNAPLVNNPYFSTGDLTGWTSDHGTVAFQSGTNGPASGSSFYAIRTGSSGTPNEAQRNTAKIPVYPGAQIKAQCTIRGIGTPNGAAGVRISWRNSSDTEIATTQGTTTTGNATNGTYVTGTAPAGAMFAHVECSFSSHTVGQYTVDNFWAAMLPDTMDQVPDGTSRFGAIEAGADKTSGKPLSSLSGRTMDYIGDSATRFAAAESGADKTAGKSIDILTDGTSYLRTTARAQSLVQNGDFETGPATTFPPPGWVPGRLVLGAGVTSPGYDTSSQYSGTRSLFFTAAQFNGYESAQTFQVTPGDYYAVGGALAIGAGAQALFGIYFLNAANAVVGNVTISRSVSGFAYSTAIGKVPATAVTGVLVLGQFNAGSFLIEADALFCARCSSYDNALAIAGSGQTLGDQRNLQPITWASQRSVLSNSPISFSISGTTVTFSVAAVSLQGGGITLNYGASSGSVTQTAGTTTTYFLYYRDSAQAGGSLPLAITTNPGGAASFPDSIFLGTANVTVNSGGGGSSGTGGGGGGYCVADDMWVRDGLLVENESVGDLFDCIDLPTAAGHHQRALQGFEVYLGERVRLITDKGAAWHGGLETPFDLPDGRCVHARNMLGEQVVTDWGTERITSVAITGIGRLYRNHFGGVSYAVGADPHHRIYSHNASISKP